MEQPFEGGSGLAHLWIPPVQGFHGNSVGKHPVTTVGQVAGGGNGDALFEEVKSTNAPDPEFLGKVHASLFENTCVGLTVI